MDTVYTIQLASTKHLGLGGLVLGHDLLDAHGRHHGQGDLELTLLKVSEDLLVLVGVGDEEVLAGFTLGVLQSHGGVTLSVGVLVVDIQQGPLGGSDCKKSKCDPGISTRLRMRIAAAQATGGKQV